MVPRAVKGGGALHVTVTLFTGTVSFCVTEFYGDHSQTMQFAMASEELTGSGSSLGESAVLLQWSSCPPEIMVPTMRNLLKSSPDSGTLA